MIELEFKHDCHISYPPFKTKNRHAKSEFKKIQNDADYPMPNNLNSNTYYSIGALCFDSDDIDIHCEKYLKKVCENETNVDATILLALYYSYKYDYEQAISLLKTLNLNNTNFTASQNLLIGCAFLWCEKIKEAKKYFMLSDSQHSMMNLGIIYQYRDINHQKMKTCYENITDGKIKKEMYYKMACYYLQSEINYEKAIEFLQKGVHYNCEYCMYQLGYIYNEESPHHPRFLEVSDDYKYLSNNELSKKYYKMAIKTGDDCIIGKIETELPLLEFYDCLKEVKNPNKHITNKIVNLEKTPKLRNLKFLVSMTRKYNFNEICVICYETLNIIMQGCFHFCCVGCYMKIDKCPICKKPHGY